MKLIRLYSLSKGYIWLGPQRDVNSITILINGDEYCKTTYFANGKIHSQIVYKNHYVHGRVYYFNGNGDVESIVECNNGNLIKQYMMCGETCKEVICYYNA